MQPSDQEFLISTLTATAEVMGTQMQPAALMLMVDDLSAYKLPDVLSALKRCRQEVSGRLTLADIIERLNSADGMPGPDEAWALVSRPESDTVILTEQMAEAMAVAKPLLSDKDKTGARMAFKDAYTRIVAEAREQRLKPKWFISLGHDKEGRAQPIADAIRAGKISLEHSLTLLSPDSKADVLALTGNINHPFLLEYTKAHLDPPAPVRDPNGKVQIASLKQFLAGVARK